MLDKLSAINDRYNEVERLISKKILRKIGNNEMKEPKIIIKESDRCAVIIKNKFLEPSS